MFNQVNKYGSLSGLTYFWLWNSISTLKQAAQQVQWLASKDNASAMAPENEYQWQIWILSSSRGLVNSNITADNWKYYEWTNLIRPKWQIIIKWLDMPQVPCNKLSVPVHEF